MNGKKAKQKHVWLPKITWVTRSFLDYRVPVFKELDSLCGNQLHVLYSALWTPKRVQNKMSAVLGERSISFDGEKSFGTNFPQIEDAHGGTGNMVIPYQPGLLRAIKRTKPDILIGDGFARWSSAALYYKFFWRKPFLLCYERTFHAERNAQWYRILYRKLVLKFVNAMCCNGSLCGDYAHSLGMPLEKITYGHMVADTEELSQQTKAVTPEKCLNLRRKWDVQGVSFLFVGQLIKRKGLHHFLKAWALLERAKPGQCTLMIVGAGPEEKALLKLAEDEGLQSVRFIGAVDYDDIAPYYASANVLVMPTLEDNWSLVVPEAMACGLPILTSKYNGCWPELVAPDKNGWVFDPFDYKAVAQCLENCLEQKAHLASMGEVSKSIIREHSPETAAQSIFQACKIALS